MAVHYRTTVLQTTFPIFVGGGVALGAVAVAAWHSGHPLLVSEARQFIGILLAVTLLNMIIRGTCVTLTPTAVMAHDLRTRVIEWRNVANVAVEKEFGYRIVVIWDVRGRRIRLHAPCSALDHEFDAKLQVIRACWFGQYDWSQYDRSPHAPTGGRAGR